MADQGQSPGDLPRGNGVLHVVPASQPSPQAPLTTTTEAPLVLQHVPFLDKLDLKDNSNRYQDWLLFKQIWQNYEIHPSLSTTPQQHALRPSSRASSPQR